MKLILLAKNSFQITEIIFYISMIATVLILLILLIPIAFGENTQTSFKKKTTKPKAKKEKKPEQEKDIVEIFDYLGTKIIHENGTYTVNDQGKVNIYNSWNVLPAKYQKMVQELDNRSLQKETDSFFLETINGIYHLTFPDGTQKKYKNFEDIPLHVRKTIGKVKF